MLYNEEFTKKFENLKTINKKISPQIFQTMEKFILFIEKNRIEMPEIKMSDLRVPIVYWKYNNNYMEINFDKVDTFTYFYMLGFEVHGEDFLQIGGKRLPEKMESFFKRYKINYNKKKVKE